MNTYSFSIVPAGATPAAGDLAAVTRMMRQIGYLWLTASSFQANGGTGATPKNTTLSFNTSKRLPAGIDIVMGTADNYTAAGNQMTGALVMDDLDCNDRMDNLDQPIVNAGNLIVAYVQSGNDISAQLARELDVIGLANSLDRIVIGRANQSAQQGVYPNPFGKPVAMPNESAFALAILGMPDRAKAGAIATAQRL